MARVNLRAAFMSGLSSTVTAQQVFTNRVDEVAAFARSVDELQRMLDEAEVSPVVDRGQGRRNVLTFYGVGGIGKTTLSHELERRLLAEAREKERDDVVTVRIDLSEEGAGDIESLLLRLRAALGQLGNRWPAFDLALASYWARAHPGEALQEFLDASPALRRASRSIALGDQIAEAVKQVDPGGLGGLTGLAHRAALVTYRAVRDRVREGRLLADCDLFAELVEADADYETLSYFPYLLAWDLERQPRGGRAGRRPRVCVFLDTFEVVNGQADRAVERLVQRCAYLMPNVLFVITGRNRIDWADSGAGGELDFAGPECWPHLHFSNDTAEPRQHLVGYLSDSDADSYLREALVRDGEPAMSAEIRERVISGGQGLPCTWTCRSPTAPPCWHAAGNLPWRTSAARSRRSRPGRSGTSPGGARPGPNRRAHRPGGCRAAACRPTRSLRRERGAVPSPTVPDTRRRLCVPVRVARGVAAGHRRGGPDASGRLVGS